MHKHTPTAGIERATTRLQQKQDRDAAPVRGCARSSVPSVGTTTTMARCSPPKKNERANRGFRVFHRNHGLGLRFFRLRCMP
mmetsp:Transcript_101594/g.206348  ORF Transcript_101594/g.206348 Transcript_101594/m.206348 type:complete len:82 (-) Transcript_101594:787-1032(-)